MGILLEKKHLSLNQMHPKQSGHEAIEILTCYFCALLLHFLHIDISGGILPQSISSLPFIGHKDFVCPFCGGTRAFIFFSNGQIMDAMHCSLLGTFISAWLFSTLPIRVIFYFKPDYEWSKNLYRLIKRTENPDWLIIAMAFFIVIQLWLHYSLGFHWVPLQQLTEN